MLNRFQVVKEEEVKNLRSLKARGSFPKPLAMKRPSFRDALVTRGGLPAVIAEYKRASPSRGLICDSISVEDSVAAYAKNGASALSVLTEEVYFKGNLEFLARARQRLDAEGFTTPILRKDFIMDALQVEMTFATPASAVLLIVRMTPEPSHLRDLRLLAESQGLDAVVEVFDVHDLEAARESGARIIQVNARDLETFKVDRLGCNRIIRENPPLPGETWIAASGILEGSHLTEAAAAGYPACLVGTALMKDGRPGEALAHLLAQGRQAL